MPFGRFEGVALGHVPIDYLRWLLNSPHLARWLYRQVSLVVERRLADQH